MTILIVTILNGLVFTLYCYLVGYVVLQKKDFNIKKRQRQNFISDDVIVSVGIPTKKEIYEI